MLTIKNLTKNYEKVRLYNNFDLDIEEGKITCILGESGSGKTTLLNCIARLTDFSGEIHEIKCSYVFQLPRLAPNLTVKQNLRLVCRDDGKIAEILQSVKLSDKADAYPSALSGGQAQRVSIARAFLYDSSVILMDEPFASLDLKLKQEIYALFIKMQKEYGRTAVLVTHDVDEAATLAQNLVIIKNGEKVRTFTFEGDVPRSFENSERLRKDIISELIKA